MGIVKFFGALLLIAVALVVSVLLTLVMTGIAIGAGNAWILEAPFSIGWDAVWDRWLQAWGWSWLFLGSGGLVIGGSSK